MLRWATIASLVLLNLSIWYGPVESIRATASTGEAAAPTPPHAEQLANNGELDAALTAYQHAVAVAPEDPAAHFEYALFCYLHADYLREQAGWPEERIVLTVQEGFYRAHCLDSDDFDKASQYALYLMDTAFFGDAVTGTQTVDAWDHVIALIEKRHREDPVWPFFTVRMSYALLQRARTESRFGDADKARATLVEVRALSPDFRIPDHLG